MWAEALSVRRGGGPASIEDSAAANSGAMVIEALDRAGPGLRALIGADLIAARDLLAQIAENPDKPFVDAQLKRMGLFIE